MRLLAVFALVIIVASVTPKQSLSTVNSDQSSSVSQKSGENGKPTTFWGRIRNMIGFGSSSNSNDSSSQESGSSRVTDDDELDDEDEEELPQFDDEDYQENFSGNQNHELEQQFPPNRVNENGQRHQNYQNFINEGNLRESLRSKHQSSSLSSKPHRRHNHSHGSPKPDLSYTPDEHRPSSLAPGSKHSSHHHSRPSSYHKDKYGHYKPHSPHRRHHGRTRDSDRYTRDSHGRYTLHSPSRDYHRRHVFDPNTGAYRRAPRANYYHRREREGPRRRTYSPREYRVTVDDDRPLTGWHLPNRFDTSAKELIDQGAHTVHFKTGELYKMQGGWNMGEGEKSSQSYISDDHTSVGRPYVEKRPIRKYEHHHEHNRNKNRRYFNYYYRHVDDPGRASLASHYRRKACYYKDAYKDERHKRHIERDRRRAIEKQNKSPHFHKFVEKWKGWDIEKQQQWWNGIFAQGSVQPIVNAAFGVSWPFNYCNFYAAYKTWITQPKSFNWIVIQL